ncbi:alpha/beta hydrolase-fold protein [Fluviicola taffensis]|uniref:alpha/beta hydrolase n=1 Tax=Fluviicola taffensis TaxID=191579 RepID=UPI0031378745
MNNVTLLTILLFPVFLFSQTQNNATKEYTINSSVFHAEREICVFVPHLNQPTDSLPVIYLFDAQWEEFYAFTNATLGYLIAINRFPACILVGIKSVDRQFELTPPPVNDDWKMPELGGSNLLEAHLLREVFPLIDSIYNPSPYRLAIGHSLGGTFILNSLVDCPELFHDYLAMSPNLQLDEGELVLKINRNLKEISQLDKSVFISIGSEGEIDDLFRPFVEKLNESMQKLEQPTFQWHFELSEKMDHATIPLSSIYRGLLHLSELIKSTIK